MPGTRTHSKKAKDEQAKETKTKVTKTKVVKCENAWTPIVRRAKAGSKPIPSKAEIRVDEASKLSPEEREKLVATAAYYRAEKRGFSPGYEIEDWIEAEMEVFRLIGKG